MADRLAEHLHDLSLARFRRGSDTLVVTVPCDDETHTVHIDTDGHATLTNHDADTLAFLRAIGNRETFPCQRIAAVADAARVWLDRRLRLGAPAGTYGASSAEPQRWKSREFQSCCRDYEVGYSYNRRASRSVLNGYDVEPGGLLPHSRTVAHIAALHGVSAEHLTKVVKFLTGARGITADPRTLPDTPRAQIRALLPAETTDHQIDNLWSLGVTLPFLAAVHEVYTAPGMSPDPAALDTWEREHSLLSRARGLYHLIVKWWISGVQAQRLRDLAAAVGPHWPAPTSTYDMGWLDRVLDWSGQEPAVVGAFTAVGVRAGIPLLVQHGVTPRVAAEIEGLSTVGRYNNTAADWIRAGYAPDTALLLLRFDSNLTPLYPEQADRILIQRDSHYRRGQDTRNTEAQRLLAVGTLVQTPARTIKWAQTGLSLEEIAAALAAKVPPGEAEKRARRGQPVAEGT